MEMGGFGGPPLGQGNFLLTMRLIRGILGQAYASLKKSTSKTENPPMLWDGFVVLRGGPTTEPRRKKKLYVDARDGINHSTALLLIII